MPRTLRRSGRAAAGAYGARWRGWYGRPQRAPAPRRRGERGSTALRASARRPPVLVRVGRQPLPQVDAHVRVVAPAALARISPARRYRGASLRGKGGSSGWRAGQEGSGRFASPIPGRGAVWLARLTGGQEVGGSNPLGPTGKSQVRGHSSEWPLLLEGLRLLPGHYQAPRSVTARRSCRVRLPERWASHLPRGDNTPTAPLAAPRGAGTSVRRAGEECASRRTSDANPTHNRANISH